MNTFIVLFRGINVGGKNKISMVELKVCLRELGFEQVTTYINSGNVILKSSLMINEIRAKVEEILPQRFQLDSELISVLVLTFEQLRLVVENKPYGFGEQPDKFHCDVLFLIGVDADEAMKVFDPREGVDTIWPGEGVVYSQRLSALRTKSRLSKIMGTPVYKSMTIRNWNTTTKLLELASKH